MTSVNRVCARYVRAYARLGYPSDSLDFDLRYTAGSYEIRVYSYISTNTAIVSRAETSRCSDYFGLSLSYLTSVQVRYGYRNGLRPRYYRWLSRDIRRCETPRTPKTAMSLYGVYDARRVSMAFMTRDIHAPLTSPRTIPRMLTRIIGNRNVQLIVCMCVKFSFIDHYIIYSYSYTR